MTATFPIGIRPWLRAQRAALLPLCLFALLASAPAFSAEPPAPPAPAAAAAEPEPADTDPRLPWFERLKNRLVHDYSQRFDVRKWSAFLQNIFDSLLVIGLALIILWIARRTLARLRRRVDTFRDTIHLRKVDTFSSLALSTFKYAVYIATLLSILKVWGVDTQSLVVGSAVIAAAVGFGSQGLVQDVITGLSILAEEQLTVGDYVEIAGKSGAVEEVGLRVIKLRDSLGVQHVIFNRTITMVSNHTTGAVQAAVDIALASQEAGDDARRVASKVCRDVARELPYFPRVPEVHSVQKSSTGEVFLRVNLRVLPQQQQVIETEFVERVKRAFAAEKIEIPDGRVRVIVYSDLFRNAIDKSGHAPSMPVPSSEKLYDGAV